MGQIYLKLYRHYNNVWNLFRVNNEDRTMCDILLKVNIKGYLCYKKITAENVVFKNAT